jgi:hypothetical protein
MTQPPKKQKLVKVFLSSTFKDPKEIRKSLLDTLVKSLNAAAMENFPYLIDEGWDVISEDGAPKIGNLRLCVNQ